MTGKARRHQPASIRARLAEEGHRFAIPSNMVAVVVASAKGGGKAVKRPWPGAKLQAVMTPEIAPKVFGLRSPTVGARSKAVVPNGPQRRPA